MIFVFFKLNNIVYIFHIKSWHPEQIWKALLPKKLNLLNKQKDLNEQRDLITPKGNFLSKKPRNLVS